MPSLRARSSRKRTASLVTQPHEASTSVSSGSEVHGNVVKRLKNDSASLELGMLTSVRERLEALRRDFYAAHPAVRNDPNRKLRAHIVRRNKAIAHNMQLAKPKDAAVAGNAPQGQVEGAPAGEQNAGDSAVTKQISSLMQAAPASSTAKQSASAASPHEAPAQGDQGAAAAASAKTPGTQGDANAATSAAEAAASSRNSASPPSSAATGAAGELQPFEDTESFDALITHGVLSSFRQEHGPMVNDVSRMQYQKTQSQHALKLKVESLLNKMYEEPDTIKQQIRRVDQWCSVLGTIGLLKHDDRHLRSIPTLPAMVYELTRNGAVPEVDKYWGSEVADEACKWLWNNCEDWQLPWEAVRLAERGEFGTLEKKFLRPVHKRVYHNVWKVNEQMVRPLPEVLDIATRADMYEFPKRYGEYGERIADDAYRWVWRQSRYWHCGSKYVAKVQSSSVPEDRLLALDLEQDRLLANLSGHMSSVMGLRQHRFHLLALEEKLMRSLLARRKTKSSACDTLVTMPRARPVLATSGAVDRYAKKRIGLLKHCSRPKPRTSSSHNGRARSKGKRAAAEFQEVRAKRTTAPKFDIKPILGKNDEPIQTRMLDWKGVVQKFKSVSMAKKSTGTAASRQSGTKTVAAKRLKKTVFTPKFMRVKPDAAEGTSTRVPSIQLPSNDAEDSSDGEEDTDDEHYLAQHTATLKAIKDKFAQFWEKQKRKKEEAREKRGNPVSTKKKSVSTAGDSQSDKKRGRTPVSASKAHADGKIAKKEKSTRVAASPRPTRSRADDNKAAESNDQGSGPARTKGKKTKNSFGAAPVSKRRRGGAESSPASSPLTSPGGRVTRRSSGRSVATRTRRSSRRS